MEIKKNKALITILVFVGIGVAIGLLVYFVINANSDEKLPDGGVQIPLSYNETRDVEIPPDITIANSSSRMGAYRISQLSKHSIVATFVAATDKAHYSYKTIGDTAHQWGGGDVTYTDYIYYDELSQQMSFNTREPIFIPGISRKISNEDQAAGLAIEILTLIFDGKYEYTLRTVVFENSRYTVTLARLIEGVPLETRNNYSEELVLDGAGQITYGKVVVAEFYDAVDVDVIKFNKLNEYMSLDAYPYTFSPGFPIGYSKPDLDTSAEFGDIHLDDIMAEDEVPAVDSCIAQSAEQSYYYLSAQQGYLAPTYTIYCLGEVNIEGISFDVPVYVYANAINPDLVYVPQ